MGRVCVAGVGVIGSLFAAHLARVVEVSSLPAPDPTWGAPVNTGCA